MSGQETHGPGCIAGLSGRDFPENARLMSPSVVFEYKYDMLHIPVRQNNENTATVRQRMQAGCGYSVFSLQTVMPLR